jgi:N-acetyl-anhydromuramyl-L-alanine amidase AmpD
MIRRLLPLVAAVLLGACSGDRALEPCLEVAGAGLRYSVSALPASPFDAWFDAAARAHGVDAALLKAVAWTETRLHMVVPEMHDDAHDDAYDHHGQPPAWGVMALRGERLERAARLAGLAPDDVRRSPAANIHAAAALLAAEARAAGVADLEPAAWGPALERFAGIELPAGRTAYARQVILPARRPAGAAAAVASAYVPAHCRDEPVVPPTTPPTLTTLWRASPNYNSRMAGAGGIIAVVIVHTCEGAYVGCWSWLTNPVSGVSAHYVVDEDGTEISQLVDEPQRAWHIGATYDCTLNRDRRCDLTGVQSNHFTIGVEHAGYASQTSFPARQIAVSAQLVCGVTQRHGIPRDGQHIVAHGQLQPWNRTDPGPNWPWLRYLALVQRACGEVVVDDDMAHNDEAYARVAASAAWTASAATPGYYGGGYRWAPTQPDADDAVIFHFFVEQPATRLIEARWTAGSNRTPAARFTVLDAAGRVLATAQHDQRAHHDEWRPLATLDLDAGWHRVELSRDADAGSVVIADAVRVR